MLIRTGRRRPQPAVRADHAVQGALSGELVGGGLEAGARHLGNVAGHLLAEAGRGIEPGADRGAAHGHPQQPAGVVLDLGDRVVEGAGVARPLLRDGQRGGVLQMGAADLDDIGPLGRPAPDGIAQPPQGRDRFLRGQLVRGDVHGRRERVVARLAHVDVVVRVDRLLGAERSADRPAAVFTTAAAFFT
ncbi:MAG TPA: hypothetical protein VIZ00_01435 [Streptosporangiaceae bacterium]